MEAGEETSEETSDEGSSEVGIEIVGQVPIHVLERDGLENSETECDSGVEAGSVMVGNLDQTSKGESNGQGLESTVVGRVGLLVLEHQDDRDEDESAEDLSPEGLPVFVESFFLKTIFERAIVALGVLGGKDRHAVGGHGPFVIDVGAQSVGCDDHAQKCANELANSDEHSHGEVRLEFLGITFADVDTKGDGRVEMSSCDSTEDNDHGEKGQGHSNRISCRDKDHVHEKSRAHQLVKRYKGLALVSSRCFHLLFNCSSLFKTIAPQTYPLS